MQDLLKYFKKCLEKVVPELEKVPQEVFDSDFGVCTITPADIQDPLAGWIYAFGFRKLQYGMAGCDETNGFCLSSNEDKVAYDAIITKAKMEAMLWLSNPLSYVTIRKTLADREAKAEMDRTVDALRQKYSPLNIVEYVMANVNNPIKLTGFCQQAIDFLKYHKIPKKTT